VRRREFILGFGGAAVCPVVARAQPVERVRRIGVLMVLDESDPQGQALLSGFTQGLAELGWTDRHNIRIDVRWAAFNKMERLAKELVDLKPEVILAHGAPSIAALQAETQMIPLVFVAVVDPVGARFVESLPRPGSNTTGFANLEARMAGKWLGLLTEIAPSVKRVAILFNPDKAASRGGFLLPSIELAAHSLDVREIEAPVRSEGEIETAIASLAREPASGFILLPDGGFTVTHRARIISLAARYELPAVYPVSIFARDGGLLSYGPDRADIFRRSASYVDRILRGAKPVDLPVQLPVKFEMIINAKTAKGLGLTVPENLLATADEVIQ
jgi:putative tryptophan/tyrosine transport system substrate-binding protein